MKQAALSHILQENAQREFTPEIRAAMWQQLGEELDFAVQIPQEVAASSPRASRKGKSARSWLALAAVTATAICFVWVGGHGLPQGEAQILPDEDIPLASWEDTPLSLAQNTLSFPVGTTIDPAQILAGCQPEVTVEGTLVVECLEAVNTSVAGSTILYITLLDGDDTVVATLPVTVVITES